ncbi:hypothetical protein NOM68_14395, partial [Proteus mirabilis]
MFTSKNHLNQDHRIKKKQNKILFILFLLSISSYSFGANNSVPKHLDCPAGKIALASQKAAIEAEMKKIDDLSNESLDYMDELSQCLGGLSVNIKIPTFPSIDGILDKIKDEACKVARNSIDEHIGSKIPSSIDPWKDIQNKISDSKYGEYIPKAGTDNIN